jgi:heme A synthase
VVAQAILGGIRVTEVSDANAVLHACLAQAFFCLLLLIAWLSRPAVEAETSIAVATGAVRAAPLLLCGSVYLQLILGALMRHFHRDGLADTGIFTTGGSFLPPMDSPDAAILLVMFLHKYWAVVVLVLGLSAAVLVRSTQNTGQALRSMLSAVAVLLLAQVGLGIAVIATGKSFWITNFHVVNGLAILALSFLAAVRVLGIGRHLFEPRESLPASAV